MPKMNVRSRAGVVLAAAGVAVLGGCRAGGPSESFNFHLGRALSRFEANGTVRATDLADPSGPPTVTDIRPVPRPAAMPAALEGSAVGAGDAVVTADDTDSGGAGEAAKPADPGGDAPDAGGADRPSEPAPRVRPQHGPLESFGATVKRDLRAAPRELLEDAKNVATVQNALILLAGGGASAMARWAGGDQSLDRQIARKYDRSHTMPRDWNETFGVAGNPGTHFALAGVGYLYGTLADDAETYNVAKTLFSALTINGLTTLAFKGAVLDDRSPNGENFAWPSGHTSSSFTTAAVLEVSYGWKVGIPAYALAGLAGLQRMDTREHWLSDVVFGATMGVVIGRSVAKGRLPEIRGWTVLPYSDGRGGGVMLVKEQ